MFGPHVSFCCGRLAAVGSLEGVADPCSYWFPGPAVEAAIHWWVGLNSGVGCSKVGGLDVLSVCWQAGPVPDRMLAESGVTKLVLVCQ